MNSCKYFIQQLSYYGNGKQASERHFVVLHLISYSSTLQRRRKQLRYFGLLFVTARLATTGLLEESPKNHTSFSLVGLQHAEFAHTEHRTRRDVRVRKDVTLISVIL